MVASERLNSIINDFPLFAESFLKVVDKNANLIPLKLNRAQLYFHVQVERQLAETGKVRMIVLKGRQQGLSTYSTARLFHHVVTRRGRSAFILAHETTATQNLFNMTKRYFDHYPAELCPSVGSETSKSLYFDELDSGYKLATAGNKGAGRSATSQYFLGSEMAFWPNSEEHTAGILQTIPLAEGTEIIFESTANGIGNAYHSLFQKGMSGEGGWRSIFIPWHMSPEYAMPLQDSLRDEEKEYQKMWQLSDEQMAWRRYKINEIGDINRFRQEYPICVSEAFETSSENQFMKPDAVLKAMRQADPAVSAGDPVILGIDPARFGYDRSVGIVRIGREAKIAFTESKQDTMAIVGHTITAFNKYKATVIFVDEGGLGSGVVDRLKELGFPVRGVQFGGGATDPKRFLNMRNYMWCTMREWIEKTGVKIPDDRSLESDLLAIQYTYDSMGRVKLETKAEAKARGVRSPDIADALALTFAYPVVSDEVQAWRDRKEFGDFRGTLIETVPGMGI